MTENNQKTNPLRLAAAVILGIIVGSIFFLVVTLVIGFFNDKAHMNIPVNMMIAENITSLIVFIILVVASIWYFVWKVKTTPPTEPESGE